MKFHLAICIHHLTGVLSYPWAKCASTGECLPVSGTRRKKKIKEEERTKQKRKEKRFEV